METISLAQKERMNGHSLKQRIDREDYVIGPNFDYPRILTEGGNLAYLAKRYPHFDFNSIASTRIPTLNEPEGIQIKGNSQKIELRDTHGNAFYLFLKVGWKGDTPNDISYSQTMPPEESVKYQYDQMLFWREAGLRTPLALGYFTVAHRGFEKHYLLMDFLMGNSLDIDLLALRKSQSYLKTPEAKIRHSAKVHEFQKILTNEKNELIESGVRVIGDFFTQGTLHLDEKIKIEPSFSVYSPHNRQKHYGLQRSQHYFERLLKFLFKIPEMKISHAKRKSFSQNEFSGIIKHFLAPLLDESRDVYILGDAYPNNLRGGPGSNGVKLSYLIDAERTMMGHPAHDLTRFLNSHLIELTLGEEADFVSRAYDSHADFLKSHGLDKAEFLREYFLLSFITRLSDMGRRASDDPKMNKQNRFPPRERGYDYHQSMIHFPEPSDIAPRSVGYPSVSDSIVTQRKSLQDRFSGMLEKRVNLPLEKEDVLSIGKLSEFLQSCGIV